MTREIGGIPPSRCVASQGCHGFKGDAGEDGRLPPRQRPAGKLFKTACALLHGASIDGTASTLSPCSSLMRWSKPLWASSPR